MRKNKMKKYNSFFIVGLMVGILFSVTGVYAVTQYASNTVYYINKNSGLSSNNVQGAIDELATIHKPDNNGCPKGYVCTKNSNVYTINLDSSFESSSSSDLNAGTVKIYLKKDDGIYRDSGYTKKMTPTANPITIPTLAGYIFKGYYLNEEGKYYIEKSRTPTTVSYEEKNIPASDVDKYFLFNIYDFNENTGKYSSTEKLGLYQALANNCNHGYICLDSSGLCDELYYAETIESDDSGNVSMNVTKTLYSEEQIGTKSVQLIDKKGYITSNFTSDKFSKTSTINAKWQVDDANNHEITLNVNKPSPLNDGYYTNGTNMIYMKYGTGVYLDDDYTKKMTISDNAITKPTAVGYNFLGYYDGDTQMIDANGKITSDFTDNTYSSEKTLTAKWKRDFECTKESDTKYMGKSWYVISNSNNICEMELNGVVGNSSGNTYDAASGTGEGSIYSYIKNFKENNTIEQEYNAGLISSIDPNSNLYNPRFRYSGVYWSSSGTVRSDRTYYKYIIPPAKYCITQGYASKQTNSSRLTYECGYTTEDYSSSILVSAGGTGPLSNDSSVFTYNHEPTFLKASSSYGGWSIYETRFTYNDDGPSNITNKCSGDNCYWGIPIYKKVYNNSGGHLYNDVGLGRSYTWKFYSCGGKNQNNSTRVEFKMQDPSDTSEFLYRDYNSGRERLIKSSVRIFLYFAGRGTRKNSLSGSSSNGKNIATYDFNNDKDCKTNYKKWNPPSTVGIPVMYMPHIKVKMNT